MSISDFEKKIDEKFHSRFRVIYVPGQLHALEDKCLSFWEEIGHCLEDLEKIDSSGLIFIQNDANVIHSKAWLEDLDKTLLLADLGERIIFIRRILYRLSNTKLATAYISLASSFGFFFELNMRCKLRMCFDDFARFGFPEIKARIFPCGGIIEDFYQQFNLGPVFWSKNSLVSAQKAVELDWIDTVGDISRWQELALSWIDQKKFTLLKSKSNLIKATPKDYELSRDDFGSEANTPSTNYIRTDGGYVDFLYKSWDACWRVIQSQSRDRNFKQKEQLIVYFCARNYLGASFRVWCDRESWRYEANYKRELNYQTTSEDDCIHIPLNDSLVPPARPIIRLLRSGFQLVLSSDHAEGLKTKLELLFGRIERVLSPEETFKLWKEKVSWVVSSKPSPEKELRLVWNADDQMIVFTSEAQAQLFLRIEGNKGAAASGWLEYSTQDLENKVPPRVLSLVYSMSDGVIHAKPVGKDLVPLTVFIRSALLEVILRYASQKNGNIHAILEILQNESWGYISSQASWDYFLIHREGTFSADPNSLKIGTKKLNPDIWQLGHWKSAVSYASALNLPSDSVLSPSELSLHVAIYCGLIAASIIQNGHVRTPQDADRMVLHATGFPSRYGTPLSCLRMHGFIRVKYLSSIYWPEFMRFGEVLNDSDTINLEKSIGV